MSAARLKTQSHPADTLMHASSTRKSTWWNSLQYSSSLKYSFLRQSATTIWSREKNTQREDTREEHAKNQRARGMQRSHAPLSIILHRSHQLSPRWPSPPRFVFALHVSIRSIRLPRLRARCAVRIVRGVQLFSDALPNENR